MKRGNRNSEQIVFLECGNIDNDVHVNSRSIIHNTVAAVEEIVLTGAPDALV